MKKSNGKAGRGRAPHERVATTAEVRRLKARAKLLRAAVPQAIAAGEELRQHAAAWAAAIRMRLTVLSAEVNRVLHASQPGTVLSYVIDASRLSALAMHLDQADCEGAALRVDNYDMPIPGLLVMRDYVCTKLFPLAEEGAKIDASEKKGGA